VPLPQQLQSPSGSFTFNILFTARALTNPTSAFTAIDFFNGTTTTRYFQSDINWTSTAWPETRVLTVTLPVSSIPNGSSLTISIPSSLLEIEKIQVVPVNQGTYDAGDVSGAYTVQLSNTASLQKATLTGDITGITFADVFEGGSSGWEGKIETFEFCQDATGGRFVNWGSSVFQAHGEISYQLLHCSDQTFRFSSSLKRFVPISPMTDTTLAGEPALFRDRITKIANGTSGCANANGCWSYMNRNNGPQILSAAAATSQFIGLETMRAGYAVTAVSVQPVAACTGGSVSAATAETGTDDLSNAFSAAYSIFDAPSTSNFQDTDEFKRGSLASDPFAVTVRTTGANVDQIAAGCSFDVVYNVVYQQ